jgi:lipopolysaccharide transport system ATP-binding protein
MSIISVENLSKQYHIGTKLAYMTLRETLMNVITSPARLFKGNGSRENSTIWALKDVSFEVKQGEVLGIIGRNGAGKSTLLKILSRVTEPTEGEVKIRGRVASLLEVGTGFHPELTGRENIYLNGAILGMTRQEIKSKFDEIVAFAEIEKFLDTPVKRYSSGMYVRLAFAVAAHLEPEILIVDEVLAVGDINFQQKCVNKMGKIASEGRTVLVVSHNMRVVETLTKQSLYLRDGLIAAQGPTLEVIKKYQKEALDSTNGNNLPSEFDVTINNPKVIISNPNLVDVITCRQTNIFEPGQAMSLSFNLEAREGIPEVVICVRFYQNGVIISGNNSNHTMGKISLEKRRKSKIQIDFDALWLIPGNYTIVVFVVPSYFASFTSSVSDYCKFDLVVQGSREYGGGYVYLRQNWKVV